MGKKNAKISRLIYKFLQERGEALSFGFFMYVCMVILQPLIVKGSVTKKELLIGIPVWLLCSFLIRLWFNYRRSKIPAPVICTVTFITMEGGVEVSQTVMQCNKIIQQIPLRDEYVFDGWYLEADYNTMWNFDTDVVTKDITLHAKWIKSTNHSVL